MYLFDVCINRVQTIKKKYKMYLSTNKNRTSHPFRPTPPSSVTPRVNPIMRFFIC